MREDVETCEEYVRKQATLVGQVRLKEQAVEGPEGKSSPSRTS